MFNCPSCQKTTAPYEQGELIVTAKHLYTFPARQKAHKFKATASFSKGGRTFRREGRTEYKDDPGGQGFQIDKEIRVCRRCAPKIYAQIKELENPSI